MSKIIISPYSRPLRNGKVNSKNYPYWTELVNIIKDNNHYVIQIGRGGESVIPRVDEVKNDLSLKELNNLVSDCDTWISVDNFFPHFCRHCGIAGHVIFGPSDPNIFGYKENINILKDRKYLRDKQFDIWEVVEADDERYLKPDEVYQLLQL